MVGLKVFLFCWGQCRDNENGILAPLEICRVVRKWGERGVLMLLQIAILGSVWKYGWKCSTVTLRCGV